MKKTAILTCTLFLAATMPAMQQALAASQIVEGVVSDSMCGKTHMMPGKTATQCTEECIKAGSSYVLVAGDKTYTLAGKKTAIAPFAGKHVRIQGDLKVKTLTVTTIYEAKTDMPAGMKM
ncbi:MAG: hypothetical protein M3O31_00220 [Acidobacteriota bacterium]|nr:hypothetical protein [Acidobacteriota bacterium]